MEACRTAAAAVSARHTCMPICLQGLECCMGPGRGMSSHGQIRAVSLTARLCPPARLQGHVGSGSTLHERPARMQLHPSRTPCPAPAPPRRPSPTPASPAYMPFRCRQAKALMARYSISALLVDTGPRSDPGFITKRDFLKLSLLRNMKRAKVRPCMVQPPPECRRVRPPAAAGWGWRDAGAAGRQAGRRPAVSPAAWMRRIWCSISTCTRALATAHTMTTTYWVPRRPRRLFFNCRCAT